MDKDAGAGNGGGGGFCWDARQKNFGSVRPGARAPTFYIGAGVLGGKTERPSHCAVGQGPRGWRRVAGSVGFGGRGVGMAGDFGGKGLRTVGVGGRVGMRDGNHVRRAAAACGCGGRRAGVEASERTLAAHEFLILAASLVSTMTRLVQKKDL